MQRGQRAGLFEELGEKEVAPRVLAELAVEQRETRVVDERALARRAEEELEDRVRSTGGDRTEVRARHRSAALKGIRAWGRQRDVEEVQGMERAELLDDGHGEADDGLQAQRAQGRRREEREKRRAQGRRAVAPAHGDARADVEALEVGEFA